MPRQLHGPGDTRLSEEQRTGWIVGATFAALLALSGALMAALNHSIHVADAFTRKDEREMVARYLDTRVRTVIIGQTGQLVWDDSVQHAVRHTDLPWMDRELGVFPWTNQGAEETMLVEPNGTLVRGWRHGQVMPDYPYAKARWQVESVLSQARSNRRVYGQVAQFRRVGGVLWPFDARGAPLSRWGSSLVWHDGRLMLLTAAAIVPDRDYALLTAEPRYLVSLRLVDDRVLHALAADLLLPDFHFVRTLPPLSTVNSLPRFSADGTRVGFFVWTPQLPGPAIWRGTAPLLATWIFLFLAVLAGGVMIVRRMRATTQHLQLSEAQAQYNALHDPMSGLANRLHFAERLREELADANRQRQAGGQGDVFVGYIDLDAFKTVNDTMGHHVGDELVTQVAQRLRGGLLQTDLIARFGGDEFVVLRRTTGGLGAANALGRQIVGLMAEPFIIAGHSLGVTCSCGISWGPGQTDDAAELLRRADIALYRAKQGGRARYRCYTNGMDATERLARELELELRRAIANDELEAHFQPIVDLATWQIEGFEALLRWPHPERGDIGPGVFVPIAEQSGLMVPLGTWMLRRVFMQCRHWPAADISINLSPIQIMAQGFIETIAALVQETGISPQRVILEVTEGVMLDRSDHVAQTLTTLQDMGFRIALDDFGIGYSSLSYLRSFQFDRIKIDRSFVQNIESDLDAQSILGAIVALGQTLRMKVVAEGVETELQRRLVHAAGCEFVQGHLFWPALPADQACALLARNAAQHMQQAI